MTYTDLPGRHITPNRLVAYNMAYWRKAAGMTQEELAQRLNVYYEKAKAWTNASVSAAERSWDGKRVRQFDADVLMCLCTIFGLPLTAFFLPPEEDGVKERYIMSLPQEYALNSLVTMWDVVDMLVNVGGTQWLDEEEDDADNAEGMATLRRLQKTNERYRDRLDASLTYYRRELYDGGVEPTYAQDAWGIPPEKDAERAEIEEKLARTRQHFEALRQLLGDIGAVQEDLNERLGLTVSQRLPEKLAKQVMRRWRAGEDVSAIAKAIRKAEWLVEKTLIDAREGFLTYSPEETSYVFRASRDVEAEHKRLAAENAVIRSRAEAEGRPYAEVRDEWMERKRQEDGT